jgi:hypothetical protein
METLRFAQGDTQNNRRQCQDAPPVAGGFSVRLLSAQGVAKLTA